MGAVDRRVLGDVDPGDARRVRSDLLEDHPVGGAEGAMVEQALLHVIEAAEHVEVVALVVIEGRLLPEPAVHRIGVDVDVVVVGVVGQVLRRCSCHVPSVREDGRNQTDRMDQPPSTGKATPVMKSAAGEASHRATPAISSAVVSRPRRAFARIVAEHLLPSLGRGLRPSFPDHRGEDEPGQDAVHPHTQGAVLDGGVLGEAYDARLRGRITG